MLRGEEGEGCGGKRRAGERAAVVGGDGHGLLRNEEAVEQAQCGGERGSVLDAAAVHGDTYTVESGQIVLCRWERLLVRAGFGKHPPARRHISKSGVLAEKRVEVAERVQMVVEDLPKRLVDKRNTVLTYTESYSEAVQFHRRTCGGKNSEWKGEAMLGVLSPMRWTRGRRSFAASPVQKTCWGERLTRTSSSL